MVIEICPRHFAMAMSRLAHVPSHTLLLMLLSAMLSATTRADQVLMLDAEQDDAGRRGRILSTRGTFVMQQVSNRAGNDEEATVATELGAIAGEHDQGLGETAGARMYTDREWKIFKAGFQAGVKEESAKEVDDAKRVQEQMAAQEEAHKAAKAKHQAQIQALRASHASNAEIKAAEQAEEMEAIKMELVATQKNLTAALTAARHSNGNSTGTKIKYVLSAGNPKRRPHSSRMMQLPQRRVSQQRRRQRLHMRMPSLTIVPTQKKMKRSHAVRQRSLMQRPLLM